jgi:hypothetical protein
MSDDAIIENIKSRLDKYLTKGDGMFCMDNEVWTIGYVTLTMFRKFLKNEVKAGRLVSEKDSIGRVWYRRA